MGREPHPPWLGAAPTTPQVRGAGPRSFTQGAGQGLGGDFQPRSSCPGLESISYVNLE